MSHASEKTHPRQTKQNKTKCIVLLTLFNRMMMTYDDKSLLKANIQCVHCVRNDCLLPDNKLLVRQKVYNESASKLWILRGKDKRNSGTHGTIWPFYGKVNTTVGCDVNTERGFEQELIAFSHERKAIEEERKRKSFASFNHLWSPCREEKV